MLLQNKNFLQEGPILPDQISDIIDQVKSFNIGAYALFLGQVRADTINHKTVTEIEYSAYPEIVENETCGIFETIFNQYNDLQLIHITHSTGKVKVGEISLIVLVGSKHRGPVFKALEETLELIKSKLPVWKKEYFNDDSYTWTQNTPQ